MRFTMQAVVCLILSGCLTLSQADPAAIGVVVSNGSFQIDDARIRGNATLFDGTAIRTGPAPSELRLTNGVRVSLGADARSRVYQDHLLLEQGESRIAAGDGYVIRAGSLRVLPDNAGASGRVVMAGTNKVQVTAMSGGMRVTNAEGILVARLSTGKTVEFEPQAAGAAAPSRLTGCLQTKGNRFLLTDETTNVTAELQGSELRTEAGNRIQVIGALDESARPVEASQVIRVTRIRRLAKGCPAGSGGVVAAAAAASGTGSGTTVAVIAGVAAATVGGLAVAEKLPGQGDSKPSASR